VGSTRVENEIVRTSAVYVSGDHDQRAPTGRHRELREFADSLGHSVRLLIFPISFSANCLIIRCQAPEDTKRSLQGNTQEIVCST
jgi:hypothetical protein